MLDPGENLFLSLMGKLRARCTVKDI